MKKRGLYIIAYDISDSARLHRALKIVKNYAIGRQKSVFECYLDDVERTQIVDAMESVLDNVSDRMLIIRLDSRSGVDVMGVAVKPTDQNFFYVG